MPLACSSHSVRTIELRRTSGSKRKSYALEMDRGMKPVLSRWAGAGAGVIMNCEMSAMRAGVDAPERSGGLVWLVEAYEARRPEKMLGSQ